jgi:hypothetical protein
MALQGASTVDPGEQRVLYHLAYAGRRIDEIT